jgi:hypothetical protein
MVSYTPSFAHKMGNWVDLQSGLNVSFTLKMEAARYFETSINRYDLHGVKQQRHGS